jgi:hypothetical protein
MFFIFQLISKRNFIGLKKSIMKKALWFIFILTFLLPKFYIEGI